jgi:opacity protein-like surface antigen
MTAPGETSEPVPEVVGMAIKRALCTVCGYSATRLRGSSHGSANSRRVTSGCSQNSRMANPDVGSIWTEGFETAPFTVHHKDIKSSPLFGIGVGWQARHWLRFDLTGEYRGDAIFVGDDQYAATGGGAAGVNEYQADIKSWLGLANAYIDMGNWCGFTPFIGAGIGFASLTVEGMKDVNIVPASGSIGYGTSHTNTNFAYAFYAGVAFDVTAQTVIDLTYRYSDLGTAQSGVVTTYDGLASISGVHVRDITSNDVMLGVRYKLQREAVVYQPVK